MERFKKIMLFILRVLKWPFIYILTPILISLVVHIVTGGDTLLKTFQQHALLLAGLIIVFAVMESVVTSAFFTEYFLVSTGIAAGIFLLTTLFISAPEAWTEAYSFDTMKMAAFLIMTGAVLVGDLAVLCLRKIRRNIRNKTRSK